MPRPTPQFPDAHGDLCIASYALRLLRELGRFTSTAATSAVLVRGRAQTARVWITRRPDTGNRWIETRPYTGH